MSGFTVVRMVSSRVVHMVLKVVELFVSVQPVAISLVINSHVVRHLVKGLKRPTRVSHTIVANVPIVSVSNLI